MGPGRGVLYEHRYSGRMLELCECAWRQSPVARDKNMHESVSCTNTRYLKTLSECLLQQSICSDCLLTIKFISPLMYLFCMFHSTYPKYVLIISVSYM